MRVPFVLGFLESIGSLLSAISETEAKGGVRCLCSATDCLQEGTVSCEAETFCYVQMIPGSAATPRIVRGCIDVRNPLLCENKRPDWYDGPWPVLYCCAGDWCNAVAIPTLPPWAAKDVRGEDDFARNDIRSSPPEDNDGPSYYDHEEVDSAPNDPGSGGRRRPPGEDIGDADPAAPRSPDPGRRNAAAPWPTTAINPVHVALPIIGACVVVGLGLASVLMLRRQRQRDGDGEGRGGDGGPGEAALGSSSVYDHTYCGGDACRAVLVDADDERLAIWRMKMHLDCGGRTTAAKSEGNESRLFITSP